MLFSCTHEEIVQISIVLPKMQTEILYILMMESTKKGKSVCLTEEKVILNDEIENRLSNLNFALVILGLDKAHKEPSNCIYAGP